MKMHGYSLVELLAAMTLAAVALAFAVPPAARLLDLAAVRGATQAITAYAGLARIAAQQGFPTELVIDLARREALIQHVDGTIVSAATAVAGPSVLLTTDSRATSVTLRFDMLGIARFANRTLRVTSGTVSRRITVSSYGRVQVW